MKNHYFQMDDRALWSELRSGSLIALEVIYRRYYSLLLNYGMKWHYKIFCVNGKYGIQV